MPLLKVDHLVTRLRNGARIVDDVSFEIAQGETFALLGESGCGKSMTALSLMRLLPDGIRIEGGTLRLGETDLTALPEAAGEPLAAGERLAAGEPDGLAEAPGDALLPGDALVPGDALAAGDGAEALRVSAAISIGSPRLVPVPCVST